MTGEEVSAAMKCLLATECAGLHHFGRAAVGVVPGPSPPSDPYRRVSDRAGPMGGLKQSPWAAECVWGFPSLLVPLTPPLFFLLSFPALAKEEETWRAGGC